MRGWVTDWEVGVDGQLCPHHTAGSPSPSITRGGLSVSYQWSPGPRQPPPACLFPFPGRLAQPPCGEERAEQAGPARASLPSSFSSGSGLLGTGWRSEGQE